MAFAGLEAITVLAQSNERLGMPTGELCFDSPVAELIHDQDSGVDLM